MNIFSADTHSIDLERGSTQYLKITDGSQTGLDITGDLSIEAWIKLEQLPSTAGGGFTMIAKYNSVGSQRSYFLHINTSDKLEMIASGDGTNTHRDIITASSATFAGGDVGSWVHVAGTYDLSGNTGILYKNGSSISVNVTNQGTVNSIHDGTSDFTIGVEGDGSNNLFDGLIDEGRIWDDIRTPTEIADNDCTELTGGEANLQGYWKLNNDATDETSNNNDLTEVNSQTYSTDIPSCMEVARRIIIEPIINPNL